MYIHSEHAPGTMQTGGTRKTHARYGKQKRSLHSTITHQFIDTIESYHNIRTAPYKVGKRVIPCRKKHNYFTTTTTTCRSVIKCDHYITMFWLVSTPQGNKTITDATDRSSVKCFDVTVKWMVIDRTVIAAIRRTAALGLRVLARTFTPKTTAMCPINPTFSHFSCMEMHINVDIVEWFGKRSEFFVCPPSRVFYVRACTMHTFRNDAIKIIITTIRGQWQQHSRPQ